MSLLTSTLRPQLRLARRLSTKPNTSYASVSHPISPVSPTVQASIDKINTYILPVYARPPFVLTKGKGSYVWDSEGRKFLDFSGGIAVNALGHADKQIAEVSAITRDHQVAILLLGTYQLTIEAMDAGSFS